MTCSKNALNSFWFASLACLLITSLGCTRAAPLPKGGSSDSTERDATQQASVEQEQPAPLRVLGKVPPFTLLDQNGDSFNKDLLEGKIWVATFIFTRCGATCPVQSAAFATLQEKLQEANAFGDVELVSFTVDPEFDTPEILDEYGKRFKADFDHWHFLTGARSDIWDLSNDGFKLKAESGRDETNLVTHSDSLILIDSKSQIRGYYPGTSNDATGKLLDDINRLLRDQYPDRHKKVTEISIPQGIKDPTWLAGRAEEQKQELTKHDVISDFKFADQRDSSGITFVDNVVDDVKRDFKAAHYDHGSSVAVADVDSDGRLDLYFVCQLGRNELWRNLGEGKFEDITDRAGVAVEDEVSVGASFADFDNDGDADLYVTRVRAPNRMFLNDGKGNFRDVAKDVGLDHVGHSSAATFFDYDRDGRLDLLLTNVGQYTTDERNEKGYFIAHSTAFTGHLFEDRAEANLLFRNLESGKFEDVSQSVGFDDSSWSGDATPVDGNNDGWPDIYLLSMQGHDEYYENQEGKRFVKKSRELFPVTAWGSMGVKVFDFNRDNQLDLFVTDMHTDMVHTLKSYEEKSKMRRNLPDSMLATDGNHILGNAFYRKDGKNKYTEISDQIGAENYWPWGVSVADLNADGYEDVFVTASMSYDFRYGINSVLLNDHGKSFVDSEFVLGVEPRSKGTAQPWFELDCDGADADHKHCQDCTGKVVVWGAIGSRSSVVFDLDQDGDLDIVTNDFGGTPMVLTSDLAEKHDLHFINLQLTGEKSNRDGIGAMVTLHTGDQSQVMVHDGKSGYLSQSRMPLYFGLGDSTMVDRIEIAWPSGIEQTVNGPIESNQTFTIIEKE
ncbi:MAG: FG-GAP-like repeat-containing protein [Rubripirellula sp.]